MKSWFLVALVVSQSLFAQEALRWSTVAGSTGVPLAVVEAGQSDKPGILFLHGFSQSALSWQAQLADSALQRDFHLVAFDLRGHGNSGKPWRSDDYGGKDWAADVAAVMQATGLDKPVVVAWSFGGLVAMHYIRHYGADRLSGLQLVGSVAQLVPQPPPSTPPDPAWFRDMMAEDSRANRRAAQVSLARLTVRPVPAEWAEQTLAAYLMMPPYAKRAIGAASGDNADLAAGLTLPVQLSGGALDPILPPTVIETAAATLPSGSVTIYPGTGHAPFAEVPLQFNTGLAAFMQRVSSL